MESQWTSGYHNHKINKDQYRVYEADEVDKEIGQLKKVIINKAKYGINLLERCNEQEEEIEQLRKLVKAAYIEGHTEGSSFYDWKDSDSYKTLKEAQDGNSGNNNQKGD